MSYHPEYFFPPEDNFNNQHDSLEGALAAALQQSNALNERINALSMGRD